VKGGKYGGSFVLSVPFSEFVKAATVERFLLKVVLPEGSRNVEVHTAFPLDSEAHTITKTYLDTTGRYTVILEKADLVEEHLHNIMITYDYPAWALLQKPLAASGAFFIVFLLSMVISRMEFQIGKGSKN